MIFRIYPTKDTFITNVQKNRVQQTGSNFGAAESLDLFKIAGVSGVNGLAATASLSRILLQFDFSSIAALTASGEAPSSLFYSLKLRHCTTSETLPASFDVTVHPVNVAWDEGRGLDVEDYYDKGFANWVKPTATSQWTSGSDYSNSNTVTAHFDDGFEDLDVDVTSIVNAWLVSGTVNNGFLIKLTSSIEANNDYNDYYIKRFYGRVSNFLDRRPYIEAKWNDCKRDDRTNMKWNKTGSLFLHNVVNGQLTNLSVGQNALKVIIADLSGTLITLTGSYVGTTGIYSASFSLPTGSYSGSLFYDRWFSGSYAFMTGTFSLSSELPVDTIEQKTYISVIKNLSNQYNPSDAPKLNVYFKEKKYRPSVVLSGTNSETTILFKSYYAIENDSTRERVVQFGTGTIESTRMSYDKNGNYFKFHMSNLCAGNVYRILFLVDNDGQQQVIDNDHLFKVV